MLPSATIPRSLRVLLEEFRPCFTAPTLRTFSGLAVGLIAATRWRTVCGMLLGAGLQRVWHPSRAHRFFALARWSADLVLCDMIVRLLLPVDAPITLAVHDTLCTHCGKKVFGAPWQHDAAAKSPKAVGYGTCFVVAGIVPDPPFLSRPVCVPLPARLWRPRHAGKIALARETAERSAARYPQRVVHLVGDAAYTGEQLRGLKDRITWTSRLKVTCVLHTVAPERTGKTGRPRTKGERPGTPGDLATAARRHTTSVRRYRRTDTVHLTEIRCPWYGALHTQTVRVVPAT